LRTGILHGLVIKILSNVWGFSNENLSIYLKFFDYNATVEMTKAIPHRFYFQRLFSGLFVIRDMLNLLKIKPLVLSLSKKKAFFLLSEGFLSKLQGRMRKPFLTFSKRLRKFMKRSFLSFKRVLTHRVKAWHVNLIIFTKPYLFYICKLFKIKKCFVFGLIHKSSISATMVARYIAAKCQQGFNLNFVLNTVRRVIRFFITDSYGYKICVSGRFTRKQIATYRWFKQGSLSLNTQNASVDYAQDSGFSKFGLFGIKLWVFGISNPQQAT